MKKKWYHYFWIYNIAYFVLGYFNILFAWIGMIDFTLPLLLAIFGGNKFFCNNLCGRGQLLRVLGTDCGLSRKKPAPRWISSKWFRYGFLVFFMAMFANMVFQTYLVAAGSSSLSQTIRLFWTFSLPWHRVEIPGIPQWVVQYSYGFYSTMLTSTITALILNAVFMPRTWCSFCPMGSMTQGICRLKKKIRK